MCNKTDYYQYHVVYEFYKTYVDEISGYGFIVFSKNCIGLNKNKDKI